MINHPYYTSIDSFFNLLHVFVVLVNCFGWAYKGTLKLNLAFLVITISSWCLLGIFYGIGFCFLTELHSIALNSIVYTKIPFSYLDYLLIERIGIKIDSTSISLISISAIFLSLTISIKKNFKEASKSIFIVLTISCLGWLLLVYHKGIGFIPDLKDPYIGLTLIVSYALLIQIYFLSIGKKFLKLQT